MEREILLLGDPRLYEISAEVKQEELETLRPVFYPISDFVIISDFICFVKSPCQGENSPK